MKRPPLPSARVLRAMLVLLLVVLLLQISLFVVPKGDEPHIADAVVVLAGPGLRLEHGERLVDAGFATTLVIMSQTPENCSPDGPRRQICIKPRPSTTRGEARALGRLVELNGWSSVLVVAQNEQVVRARFRVERCLPGGVEVRVVAVRASAWESIKRVLYETVALPKALVLQRSC